MKHPSTPRKGGRPSQARAALIQDEILDIATRLFLTQGYGATSIEAIAQKAGISKRTFYARFANKEEVFAAVVRQLVTRLKPKNTDALFAAHESLEAILLHIAPIMLRAALTPDALAMQRLMVSEGHRFPELVTILHTQGVRQEALERVAALLQMHDKSPDFTKEKAMAAAEQFIQLIVGAPQRRALGLGLPMSEAELALWPASTVQLFLHGFESA